MENKRPAQPTPWAIARGCARIAAQGWGGVLPVARREVVEQLRWMDDARFAELLAASQVMPGATVVNVLAAMGWRFAGWRGVAAAMSGLFAPPLLALGLLVALLGTQVHEPWFGGAMRGMAGASAGLIAGTAWRLAPALRGHALGSAACAAIIAAALVGVLWLRLPLLAVLAAVGLPAWAATARAMRGKGSA